MVALRKQGEWWGACVRLSTGREASLLLLRANRPRGRNFASMDA